MLSALIFAATMAAEPVAAAKAQPWARPSPPPRAEDAVEP